MSTSNTGSSANPRRLAPPLYKRVAQTVNSDSALEVVLKEAAKEYTWREAQVDRKGQWMPDLVCVGAYRLVAFYGASAFMELKVLHQYECRL